MTNTVAGITSATITAFGGAFDPLIATAVTVLGITIAYGLAKMFFRKSPKAV